MGASQKRGSLDFSDQAAVFREAETNVLHDWRWRYCEHFVIGFQSRRQVVPSCCATRTEKYGYIGCTKFQPAGR